jgi:fructose-1,6-bisphosphatase II / sedoheptulose-1,7-bisphosphatase
MRKAFDSVHIDGTVVIGEGERDEAPMLYIGEKVGNAPGVGPQVDIALDPLEGTTLCAHGGANSLAVIAIAEKGGFLHAPDVYMDKIAIGQNLPQDLVDIDATPLQNLQQLAKAKKCAISDLMVSVLDRPRHAEKIAMIREAGAKIQLIGDGDVAASIATCYGKNRIDMYMGTGGAPEGVLAAAALKCLGGQFYGRLIFENQAQIDRAISMGVKNPNAKLTVKELVTADAVFIATGVTSGWFLKGVKKRGQVWNLSSFVTHFSQNTTYTLNSIKPGV